MVCGCAKPRNNYAVCWQKNYNFYHFAFVSSLNVFFFLLFVVSLAPRQAVIVCCETHSLSFPLLDHNALELYNIVSCVGPLDELKGTYCSRHSLRCEFNRTVNAARLAIYIQPAERGALAHRTDSGVETGNWNRTDG